jgi:hypothetical protein
MKLYLFTYNASWFFTFLPEVRRIICKRRPPELLAGRCRFSCQSTTEQSLVSSSRAELFNSHLLLLLAWPFAFCVVEGVPDASVGPCRRAPPPPLNGHAKDGMSLGASARSRWLRIRPPSKWARNAHASKARARSIAKRLSPARVQRHSIDSTYTHRSLTREWSCSEKACSFSWEQRMPERT